MKSKKVIELFNEFADAGNRINAYYVTYKATDNATSQKWGKLKTIDELIPILDEIEKSPLCVQGELPIIRLMIYADDQCMAILENPLWNCVNDESDDSHIVSTIPFISRAGKFGTIKEWINNQYNLTNEDMVGDLKGFPVGVVVKMLELQIEQTNILDVSVFEKNAVSDKNEGGFNWATTEDGSDFWEEVIYHHNFSVFFEKYSDYERYNF